MIDGESYYENQSQARKIESAEDVRRISAGENEIFERLFDAYLPADPKSVIYEAATGPGILQAWLKAKGYECLEGSDFSKNEALMAQQINPRVVHADSVLDLETRFAENTLSVIIALDFFEHVPRERFRDFLKIAASRLRPGGFLIMRGPNGDSPFVGRNLFNDITHVWTYTTVCLSALTRLAGFRKVEYGDDSISGLYNGYWWKKPLMVVAQVLLSAICWAASRQRVRYWGMSIYVYAQK